MDIKFAHIKLDTGVCFGIYDLYDSPNREDLILLADDEDVTFDDIYENGVWTRPEPKPDVPVLSLQNQLKALEIKNVALESRIAQANSDLAQTNADLASVLEMILLQ